MQDKNLLVIGFGNMGAPIVERALNINFKPHLVLRNGSEKIQIAKSKGLDFNVEEIPKKHFEYVLLAIKPQGLGDIDEYVQQFLEVEENSKAVIISVLAGVEISKLQSIFPKNPIVRTMPNLGLKIGKGFTLAKHSGLNNKQFDEVSKLLSSLGTYQFVDDESWLNKIIPISGSCTGFAAYFILQLVNSGIKLGLPEELCRQAVLQTLESTVSLCELEFDGKQKDIADLVDQVCSKGGATRAGINFLEENHFSDIISGCVEATLVRADELSKLSDAE